MNTVTLKEKAKVQMEEISHDVNELKIKTEQLNKRLRSEWEEEIKALESARHSLEDICHKISKASEESVNELSKAFNEKSESAQKRIDHLREIYSKTLN